MLGLELPAPGLQRLPLPTAGILPAVAEEGVDVLQLAGRRQPLESRIWGRAHHVLLRDLISRSMQLKQGGKGRLQGHPLLAIVICDGS